MKTPRKNPRINVRFKSLQETDELEQYANQRGFTLQNWMRMLAYREITNDLSKKLQVRELFEILHILQAILEHGTDEDVVLFAKQKARRLIENFNLNAEHDAWIG